MPTNITPLPSAPNRNDSSTFSAKADAWVAALGTWTTEVNTVAGEINTNAGAASSAASTATTKAAEASASAAAAANSAGATLWVSGSTYLAGQSAIDPVDFYTYRRNNTGSGTTRPGLDTGNWVNISGNVSTTGTQTLTNKTLTSPTVNNGNVNNSNLNDNTINGPKYTVDDDGSITGGTWVIDYANGPLIKATVGAAITSITLSNLPASGTLGHLKLMLVNPGAYAITFPAAWKFIKRDFTTTNFAGLGATLPASGVVFFDLITEDGGSNVYVTISRN